MIANAVCIVVEEPAWKKSGVSQARLKAAARLALERVGGATGTELTLLLTDDSRQRALNAQFRNKDKSTNVLSFPAKDGAGYLGDIAIALGVSTREATECGVSMEAHTLHLVVHGVLHLLGYDHVRAREARVMESLETAILKELGIADPYARVAHAE